MTEYTEKHILMQMCLTNNTDSSAFIEKINFYFRHRQNLIYVHIKEQQKNITFLQFTISL